MSLLTITGLSMTKEVAFNESSISVLLQEEALLQELQGTFDPTSWHQVFAQSTRKHIELFA